VDELLHRRFGLPHEDGGLPGASIISKREGHREALLRRQPFHEPPERLDLEVADRCRLDLGGGIGQTLRQLLTYELVTEVVDHRVGGDPIKPAGKGAPAVLVSANAAKGVEEDLGRYVLGLWGVTETCIRVAVDAGHMAVIEDAEGIGVSLRPLDEKPLILVHARSLWRNRSSVITEFTDCEEGWSWW
jgi:hypothetical protein